MQSTAGFKGAAWGAANDFVAPGDYDGDGKTDLAAIRDVNGTLVWYILASTAGYIPVGFGDSNNDFLAQGDYDGDGKTDVAVWRNTNGTFYYLNSSNGSIGGTPWGAANDFPVASYDTH